MDNTYRNMMEEIKLSAQAKQAFAQKLEREKPGTGGMRWLGAVAVAACLCLAVTTVVFAVDTIFDLGLAEIVKRPNMRGQPGVGYDVAFEVPEPRPVTDFAEKWRSLDGAVTVEYASWEEAQADMGLKLAENTVLFQSPYTPRELLRDKTEEYVRCYANYTGRDGQLYCAAVRASYWCYDASVFLTAVATAEHATVSREQLTHQHDAQITYPEGEVKAITTETYTAASGITATIVAVQLAEKAEPNYEAVFMADGISYRVQMYCQTARTDGRAELIRILEGFVF